MRNISVNFNNLLLFVIRKPYVGSSWILFCKNLQCKVVDIYFCFKFLRFFFFLFSFFLSFFWHFLNCFNCLMIIGILTVVTLSIPINHRMIARLRSSLNPEVIPVFLLLTLNRFHTLFWCYCCWLKISKCRRGQLSLAVVSWSWLHLV